MNKLFAYFKRVGYEKREFNKMQERARALPEEYAYVYHKIQHYMWWHSWKHLGGIEMDMTPIFADLLDLFETGAAEGKRVLDVTGEDVAEFCDELLRNANPHTGIGHEALNHDIMKTLGTRNGA